MGMRRKKHQHGKVIAQQGTKPRLVHSGVLSLVLSNKKRLIIVLAVCTMFFGGAIFMYQLRRPSVTEIVADADTLLQQAKEAYEAKDYITAAERARKVSDVTQEPTRVLQAQNILELCLSLQGDMAAVVQEAEKHLNGLDTASPYYAIAVNRLARAYAGNQQFSQAVSTQERMLALYSENKFEFPYDKAEAQRLLDSYKETYAQQGDGANHPFFKATRYKE